MADESMNLAIDITGEAGSAVGAFQQTSEASTASEASIARLEAAVQRLVDQNAPLVAAMSKAEASITNAGTAATGAAAKVTAHADATSKATKVASEFNSVGGDFARAASAMGVASGEAAGRIGALAGALDSLKTAAAPIMVVTTAVTAMLGAFEFLKNGIESAEHLQGVMETMRASVEAQGGAWDTASASIKRFIENESLASGFTQGQLATALNELVTANISVKDSETILSVAEETAVAKHMDVLEVVRLLIDAEAGRGIGLAKLDPQLKEIIRSHGTLSDVLKVLHKDNQDQLDDTKGLEQAKARERVAWDNAAEAIGEHVLPALTAVSYEMIGALKNASDLGKGLSEVIAGIVTVTKSGAKELSDFAQGVGALFTRDFVGSIMHFKDALGDQVSVSKGLIDVTKGVGDTLHQFWASQEAGARGYDAVLQAIKQHQADIGHIALESDPNLGLGGTKTPSGRGSGSVGSTKTPDGHGSATVADLFAGIIPSAQQVESVMNQFYEKLGAKDLTTTQQLDNDWSKFAVDSYNRMQDDLATFDKTNSQKADYFATIWMNMSATDDESLARRKQAYTSYIQAIEAEDKQRFQQEQQFENTAAQKMSSFIQTIVVEHKSMASALKSIYDDILKYFIDMVSKMLAEAMMALPWIQAIFGGGGGINTSFITPGVGPVFGIPGWPGGPPVTPGNNATQTPPAAGGNIGGGGTAPIMSSPAIAAMMNSALSPSGGGGSVGSGSYDTSGGIYTPAGPPATSIGAPASGTTQTSSGFHFGAGFGNAPGIIAGLLGRSGIGGLGMAAFGGSMIGDIAFGGKGYSALGGMLGGLGMAAGGALALGGAFGPALMAMMSQPVGWALIAGAALLGAFGGSLFGNHFNPADEPDISQTDAWGQANADMQGSTQGRPMTANGKQFVMDSQTASATGGRGWNILMEKFVNQYRGQVSSLPYTLQSAFPELEQLWGGATDKADFNPDGKNGYLDIGSGKRALWTEFWQNVNQYGSQISQLMQSNSPISMYVESVNGSMQSIGSGSQTPGGNSNPFMRQSPGPGMGSNSIAAGGGGKSMASLAQRLSQSLAININVRNSSTLADSANLERALRDAFATTLPSSIEDLNTRG